MGNWFKRLFERLFGDESEEEQESFSNIPRGRILSSDYEEHVRVIHQYPKTGNFRFPLIPDDEPVGVPERKEKKQPAREAREKFTGKDFKATDVPSPVYGFRKRTDLSIAGQLNKNQNIDEAAVTEESSALQEERDDVTRPSSIPAVVNEALEKERHTTVEPHVEAERKRDIEDDHIDDEGDFSEQIESETFEDTTESAPSDPLANEDESLNDGYGQNRRVLTFTMKRERSYLYPQLTLLDQRLKKQEESDEWILEQKKLLNETLRNFNVHATVTNVIKGPTITRFEVQPKPGVKVSKITNLADDIKLNLSAKEIRIEAPIPGKNAIGIEVPNRTSQSVTLREMIESSSFQAATSPLAAALGVDIAGNPVVTDLKKMPHGLIAGATGSGKSVCINSILTSILFKANPDDVKLMLIDPKVVELAPYNDLPHLVTPVITDVKDATAALKWAVDEMEERYKKFANTKVRDIERYNEQASEKMPYIVIIIDELADLMMVSPQEVEDAICRIAQKARACGIHLLVATQRPSVDVITGLIKANIPTRIAFSVSSQVDSRTILDAGGAEKLLGKGDMLFLENGASQPVRLQGNFVSDDEIERITEHIKRQRKPDYLIELDDLSSHATETLEDELFPEACEFIFQQGSASSSSLQRRFRIGYNRAARLIDMMEERGLISQANGSKPRKILMTRQEFEKVIEEVEK